MSEKSTENIFDKKSYKNNVLIKKIILAIIVLLSARYAPPLVIVHLVPVLFSIMNLLVS